MHPVLTMHAPRRLGSSWVLAAEVRIGGDTVTVQAKLSPQTIQWALANAASAARWVKEKALSYVSYRGDWSQFGFLAEVAMGATNRIAASPALASYERAREALPLYRMAIGEKGSHELSQAQRHLALIQTDCDRGVPAALEARDELDRLHKADGLLHQPDAYQQLGWLTEAAKDGIPEAVALLGAVKALGTYSDEPVYLDYDVEEALTEPASIDSLAGLASDVLAFRAMGERGPKLEPHQVSRIFASLLPSYRKPHFGGYPPSPSHASSPGACPSCQRKGY